MTEFNLSDGDEPIVDIDISTPALTLNAGTEDVNVSCPTPHFNLNVTAETVDIEVAQAIAAYPQGQWTVTDVSDASNWANILGTFDGGTGFAATVEWTQIGRLVMGTLLAEFAADHGTAMVPMFDLAAAGMPVGRKRTVIGSASGGAQPSAFTYVTVLDSSADPFGAPNNDGFLVPLGSTLSDISGTGVTNGSLLWVHIASPATQPTNYLMGNLWFTNGGDIGSGPITGLHSVDGRAFGLVSAFWYEASTDL